ncbi:MAG: HlyD family efflux transporter periplasmic adaptor subunit [Ignavibacteriales bacterium]|nr:HlyD family efflux transporter periplasmic adaptor subunit [Ignavibacteriales bacterium]
MKTKRILIALGLSLILVIPAWLMFPSSQPEVDSSIVVAVKRGQFVVSVTTTGELQAKKSIEIKGPEMARAANIWQMKISNLVPEGTVVKSGGFVAELDRSEIAQKLKDSELSVQKFQSQFEQAILDSALELSKARDEIVNLAYTMEEKRIAKEQAIYEAPAMKRQAEIDQERAQKALEQARKNYRTKQKQAIAKIRVVDADLMKEKSRMDIMARTLMDFTIKAPADGMVIYAREWNGRKKVVGSTINAWDPTVATLPDLSVMESITYINEVDIQKLAVGQRVELKLDADPNKKLSGKVTQLANIGEQRPNADSKVFEVKILVNESDTTLRPAMTTSNTIIVSTLENVLSVPLEAVQTEGGRSFVFRNSGGSVTRQEVVLGMMNENNVIVERGLSENDLVYLSQPESLKGIPTDSLSASTARK